MTRTATATMTDERLSEIRFTWPAMTALERTGAMMELADEVKRLRAERSSLTESVAVAIYDAMRENDPEGRTRPWVEHGNSLKQDEARRRARGALLTVKP